MTCWSSFLRLPLLFVVQDDFPVAVTWGGTANAGRGLNAFFCAQYINIGTGGADLSSSFFLPKIVGWGKAAEMCMTGERVFAQDAYRVGLANHVVTREELLPAARAMAAVMCSKNKFGLRMTKDAFNAALNGSSLEDANRMEDRNQALIIANAITEGAKQLG